MGSTDNGVMERRASWAGKEHVQTARLFGHLEASPVGSLGDNFPPTAEYIPSRAFGGSREELEPGGGMSCHGELEQS